MKFRGLDVDDFIVLALLGSGVSVTEIGRKLHITQPAISQRLAKMKDFLGVPLVIRSGRGVVLTAYGRFLSNSAKDILLILIRSLPDPSGDRRCDSLIHDMFGKTCDRTANERNDA
jgi:DNA-binding transcriptional LysR family regulator